MGDGGGIKQFSDEMEQATGQVAKDVKDQVGQAIEQGSQSLVGPKLTPQQLQQKQLEEQQRLTKARNTIKWYQDIAAAQKKVREEEKQKQIQRQQLEQQKKQNKKLEETQRKQAIPQVGKRQGLPLREDIARTRQEIGKGHGVGG